MDTRDIPVLALVTTELCCEVFQFIMDCFVAEEVLLLVNNVELRKQKIEVKSKDSEEKLVV